MSIKTPTFWYPKDGKADWRIRALMPLSFFYGLGFWFHQTFSRAEKADIPVLCVGNLVAGGTGKTPCCIALLQYIRDAGLAKNPGFMLRGYGGASRGPVLVNPKTHSDWDVGDEALILTQHAPTIVAADRVAGAALAADHDIDFLIMDDGLQNPGIHKDIKIIVVNGEMGFGNGEIMPAGPLREPLARGLKKADAFILIGDDGVGALDQLPKETPLMRGNLIADEAGIDKKQAYFAFAGLGYPEKFFNFLRDRVGLKLVETRSYPDHCPYEISDLQDLLERADALGAKLITTQKDYLRLPEGKQDAVQILPISMNIEGVEALDSLIKRIELS